MFSIDSKATWLIGEGHYNAQLRGRCVFCVLVCVCVGAVSGHCDNVGRK